jgi:peptidoglycan hydrolase-like protein with peptidoglycan-binding domain
MDVGHGSVAPPAARSCGVRVDFAHYRTLRSGDHSPRVAAAQCLLRHAGLYDGRVTGRFDQDTETAVRGFQRSHKPLGVTGTLDSTSWTALLADGRTPVLKYGAASNAVRRLQRSLNATRHSRLPVTGVFAARTEQAVARYQHRHGLARTGVVNDGVWRLLQTGNR